MTRESDTAGRGSGAARRWKPHRGLAWLVRATTLVGPILTSIVFVWAVTHLVDVQGAPLWMFLLWWIALSVVATGIFIGLDRLARRLLPLAALLNLSLVFPDQAPSRFRTAMSTLTPAQLRRELDSARNGEAATRTEAAERLLRLVAALGAHDRLTRGHSERVRAYSQMIGSELGLPREDIDRLNWAALIHDVGKLTVPAGILNKDGLPSREEWPVLRRHAEEGERLVEPLRSWLGEWCDAVGQHHERWDGNGYPRGLGGEEISLAGRIVAVADVFDVITSPRSYKSAGSVAEARRELIDGAGSQFDPRVVRAFLSISLTRLRLALGPLAWLAGVPLIRRGTQSTATAGVLGALAISATALGGAVSAGASVDGAPSITAAPSAQVAQASGASSPAAEASGPERRPTPSSRRVSDPLSVAPRTPIVPISVRPPSASTPTLRVAPDQEGFTFEDRSVTVRLDLAEPDRLSGLRVVREPDFGNLSVVADDALRYDPEPDFSGRDTAEYEACWLDGQCAHGLLTFDVAPLNDPPIAVPDALGTDGAPRIVEVLANDRDPDGDSLTVTLASDPIGTATVVGDRIRYTPPTRFTGMDRFEYRVDDGNGGHDTATVTMSVNPTNRPPVAADDEVILAEDSGTIVIDPLANDSNRDGARPVIESHDDSAVLGGALALGEQGLFTYTPAPDFSGVDRLVYTIADSQGGTDTATVTITVTPVNDAPSFGAGADVVTTEDAGPQVITGWATGISAGPADESDQTVGFRVTTDNPALFGEAPALSAAGALSVTPAAQASGVATVTARAFDDGGTAAGGVDVSAPRSFSITVTPVNDSPSAADDAATVLEDSPATTIDLLANDADPDGPALRVTGYDASTLVGSLRDTRGGSVEYLPAPDFAGTETFRYSLADGRGGTDSATATITVLPVNDPPSFSPGADVTVSQNAGPQVVPGWASAISIGPANETGQTVAFVAVADDASLFSAGPAVASDGTLSFTPASGASGVATVTVRAVDDGGTPNGGSDTGPAATLTITVQAAPQALGVYLGVGDPRADEWDLVAAPAPGGDPVPDYDADGAPGLTIAQSSGSDAVTDPAAYHDWILRPTEDLVLDGAAALTLAASATRQGTGQPPRIWAYLYACDAGGANCETLAQRESQVAQWNAADEWTTFERQIGRVARTIPSGGELRLRLLASNAPIRIASSASLSSMLSIGA